jgi:aryl-alcohol dehydrogenase-like predicted oxidoreductase
MKRRLLGKTGFEASVLGIGDLADRSVPLEKCVATLHRAMDYGLNLIDTAPMYESGYSEQIVGAALKGRRDGIDELQPAVAGTAARQVQFRRSGTRRRCATPTPERG